MVTIRFSVDDLLRCLHLTVLIKTKEKYRKSRYTCHCPCLDPYPVYANQHLLNGDVIERVSCDTGSMLLIVTLAL